MQDSAADKDDGRYPVWHSWMVEFGEAEGCFAEFAVLFLGMRQPLHQAVLVDVFDAAAAFARVEQRLLSGALATTYSAGVGLVFVRCSRIVCVGGHRHGVGVIEWSHARWSGAGGHDVMGEEWMRVDGKLASAAEGGSRNHWSRGASPVVDAERGWRNGKGGSGVIKGWIEVKEYAGQAGE